MSAKPCAKNSNVVFQFPTMSLQFIDSEIAEIERILARNKDMLAPNIADLEKYKAMRPAAVRLAAKK